MIKNQNEENNSIQWVHNDKLCLFRDSSIYTFGKEIGKDKNDFC